MNPSPRVSVCRSGRQHGGQGSCQGLTKKDFWSWVGSRVDEVLSPAGQSLRWLMPRDISVAWSSTLVCWAWLSQQWSRTWLSYTLKGVTFIFFSINALAPLLTGKCGISPGANLWVVCSADMAVLITCADILGVSPCRMCLLWLR